MHSPVPGFGQGEERDPALNKLHSSYVCAVHCSAGCSVGLGACKVVAKLEDMDGLVNHQSILGTADAVIFSRGSMGTCLLNEKVRLTT